MTSPVPPAPVQVGIKAGDPQVVGIARSLVLVDGVFHKVAGPHEHPEGQPQTESGRTPCGACRELCFSLCRQTINRLKSCRVMRVSGLSLCRAGFTA